MDWKQILNEAKELVNEAQDDKDMPDKVYKECNHLLFKIEELIEGK